MNLPSYTSNHVGDALVGTLWRSAYGRTASSCIQGLESQSLGSDFLITKSYSADATANPILVPNFILGCSRLIDPDVPLQASVLKDHISGTHQLQKCFVF